jgi:hypothetical protein
VDNHYMNNVIFPLVGADGIKPLGPEVWAEVARVRDAVLSTIESLSPPEWSFIFTHVLIDHPGDAATYARIENVARARGSDFVPVTLTCDLDQLTQRMTRPERKDRLKWVDGAALREFVASKELLSVEHPNALEIDTTAMTEDEVAEAVLAHVNSVSLRHARQSLQ